MYLINAKYLDKDFRLAQGDIQVDGGKIVQTGPALAGDIQAVRVLTQTEYDALSSKNASTLYLIKE